MNVGLNESYLAKSTRFDVLEAKNVPKDFGALKEAKAHRQKFLWAYVANIVLALFLLTTPSVLPYQNQSLLFSDIACGVAVVLIEFIA